MNKSFIVFDQFEKWYGQLRAAGPLGLELAQGETFVLLGPNGSGKSTILRTLVGLMEPTRGRILIGGRDIAKKSPEVRKAISYLPQKLSLPERMTGREILEFFCKLKSAPITSVDPLLEEMALAGDAHRESREYSGGMLQRLGLAIALLGNPQILVMDEPTLNLDPVGREKFRTYIKGLKSKSVTVIFSSHILQDAEQLGDRVGVFVEGRLASLKTVSTFRNDLSLETTVRVVLTAADKIVESVAQNAGATTSDWLGSNFLFKAPPERRLAVIRAIEEAGGIISEFHYDPPNWEALIGRQFNRESQGNRTDVTSN